MTPNNEQFLFREPFVLLTIICLSSLTQTPMENIEFHAKPVESVKCLELWIYHVVIPVPGIILVAVLSKILGRKFAFKVLCVLTLISSFLKMLPWFTNGVNVMQNIITGGVLATTFLAISEYSPPKHRLAYLIGNTVARETVGQATSYVLGKWLPVFEFGMGLLCLASSFTWPETPYWLAGKRMHEESKAALLWLRKDSESAHKELRYFEYMPRAISWPMLLWRSLLPFVAIWINQLAYGYQYSVAGLIDQELPRYLVVIQRCVIISVIGVIISCSYTSKRNSLFFIVSWMSVASNYIVVILVVLDLFSIFQNPFEENSILDHLIVPLIYCSNMFTYCGIYVIINAICIELIPLGCNTLICCFYAIIVNTSPLLWMSIMTLNIELIGVSTFLVMSLLLCGVTIIYKLSPKTHNKNLLEIQESYLPIQENPTPERIQSAVEHIRHFCNTGAIHLRDQY